MANPARMEKSEVNAKVDGAGKSAIFSVSNAASHHNSKRNNGVKVEKSEMVLEV